MMPPSPASFTSPPLPVLTLPGLRWQVSPVFFDDRGHLVPVPNNETWQQINVVWSAPGVVRGLHYQFPHSQAKCVGVLQGRIWDVIVDLRQHSPTFGQWQGVWLQAPSADFPWLVQLYVPHGFAHGYCTLEAPALVHYCVDAPYRPEEEVSLHPFDPTLKIAWPLGEGIGNAQALLSPKDAQGLAWSQLPYFSSAHLPAPTATITAP